MTFLYDSRSAPCWATHKWVSAVGGLDKPADADGEACRREVDSEDG
jgi:hypothetical protein